jgi:hypothetical protein
VDVAVMASLLDSALLDAQEECSKLLQQLQA